MSAIESKNATVAIPPRVARRTASLAITGVVFFGIIFASPMLLPGWVSMLVNVAAVFYGFKHCIWLVSPNVTRHATLRERFEFYFLSPAFDLHAFLDHSAKLPSWRKWCVAFGETMAGALVLWGVIPRFASTSPPLVTGIAGMLGGALFILFGLFHLAALAWQRAGRGVRPIMNHPWAADSLADFWGRRWNMSFRDSAKLLVFRPLARRWGSGVATFGTFFASGLLHEVVVSLPARGGYGLPTLYFLIQYIALAMQKRFIHDQRNGWNMVGRATTAVVVLAPVPLLFHPLFCERVLGPFLRVLGIL